MKIGRPFPKPARVHWRLKKARAAYINRNQWARDNNPEDTPYVEIYTGEDYFIATEASTPENEIIIIAES